MIFAVLSKYIYPFMLLAFSTSLRMYPASELVLIKDVLEIYTQQKQNECMLSTTCLESKGQQVLVDHTVKPCTFAMYDCRQPEDVSSIESVRIVPKILSQVFIRCCHLHLPSLSSVVPQAFGALELNGPLDMTSYIMFT